MSSSSDEQRMLSGVIRIRTGCREDPDTWSRLPPAPANDVGQERWARLDAEEAMPEDETGRLAITSLNRR